MSIKKYAASILFLIIIMFGKVYAYTNSNYTSFESASSSGYSKVTSDVYFNQLMELQNVKVKFTQDENNYIFHITGSSSLNVYKDVVVTSIRSSSGAVAPMLYKTANFGNNMYVEESSKTPFADFTGTLNSSSTVKIGSTIIDHFEERYNVDSEGHKKNYTSDSTGNGDKYFIPNSLRDYLSTRTYNFRYSTQYPFKSNNNGIGVSILQNSSNCTYSRNDVVQDGNKCIDYCYFNVNTKISINKSYIDDYRYVCFAQTYTLATSSSNSSLSASVRGISICTQTIDLKEYAECNHNWSIHIEDKTNHYKYCENCEWKITVPHELLYEYDGIKHNVCICSYIDKVNYQFKIHDDFIEEVTETLDTDAEYIKYEFQHKTGYKFMHYDVYEKRFVSDVNLSTISNALKTVFIATTSELADRTSILSQIYEAKYEPIKFTIYYNNKNNKQIELDETIDPQIIEYDEVAYLRNNIHCVGYLFKGWSFVEEGDSVDLLPHCEMTNYTATDGYEINLYPVYENLNFKIVYSAGGGHFSDGSKYKEVDYTYYDDNELEKVFSNNSALYFKWYVDDNGNKFSNMTDVKNYVERNGAENITLNLFPIFGRIEVGGSGRTNGGGPGGNGSGGNGAGGSGGVGPGYDVLPSESYDNQNSDDENISSENNYFPYIVPFSNSEIANSSEEDDENEENVTDGAVIATLSFIIKEDTPDVNQYSKWNVLLLFIKNNLFICVFGGIALLLLLIIYEIIIISRFRRSFNTLRD
jgi:hypothetical protein